MDAKERQLAESEVLAGRSEPLRLNGSEVLVRDHLIGLGMPIGEIGTFLDETGRWSLRRDFLGYLEMEPTDLIVSLKKDFEHVYKAVDLILAASKPTGFNSHGWEHHERSLRYAVDLAKNLNLPETSETTVLYKRMAIEHLTHDLKMITGRVTNDEDCEGFYKMIFGISAVDFNPHLQKIVHAINLHSEKRALENADLMNEDIETLLLIFGDKTDWHRGRSARTGAKAQVVGADVHVRLMAFLPYPMDIKVSLGDTSAKSALLSIHFDRNDKAKEFPVSFRKKGSTKLLVPKWWHYKNKQDSIWYISQFMADAESEYGMRMCLQTVALFGLFKDMEAVTFHIKDPFIHHYTGFEVFRDEWQEYWAFIYYNNGKTKGVCNREIIRDALEKGQKPEFPAIFGPNVFLRMAKRFDVNLPVTAEKLEKIYSK